MLESLESLPEDFLHLRSFTTEQLDSILGLADEFREQRLNPANGLVLALLFEKPSTRTRVSFSVAMHQLGGDDIFMSPDDIQLKRGETRADTAQTLTRYVDAIAYRTYEHERIETLANNTNIPVINALTDSFHPCQALSDAFTCRKKYGNFDFQLTFVGDGNNVCQSLLQAAKVFGFNLIISNPKGYEPLDPLDENSESNFDNIHLVRDPMEAVQDTDFIYSDVWASMGQEDESNHRQSIFEDYQVNASLVEEASASVKVMHCLPAHRGEEITGEIMDGPKSIVFDQAENRLHVQKALLAALLLNNDELQQLV